MNGSNRMVLSFFFFGHTRMGSGCVCVGAYAGRLGRASGWRGHWVVRVHKQVRKDVGGRDPARRGSGTVRWARTGCDKVVGVVNSLNG